MWGEVLKVVLTSASALLVAWAVFTFKEGGRHRLQRREIVEELELIKLLDHRPDAARSVQQHVDELLHEYLSPARPTWRRRMIEYSVRVVLSFGLGAIVVWVPMPWWSLSGVVLVIGLSGAAAEVWLERRWQRQDAELDRAAH